MSSTSSLALSAFDAEASPQSERSAQHLRGGRGSKFQIEERGKLDLPERPIGKRIIRTDDVLRKIPWSRTTLWRRIRSGDFPPPFPIGPNMNGWLEETVDGKIAALVAEASK